MSKDFTVSNWTPWIDRETNEPITDPHGNFKGTVWFEEDSRQADGTFKTEPRPGDKKFGDLVDYTTQSGKTRLKFQRAERPQEPINQTSDNAHVSAKREWKTDDEFYGDKNAQIKAQWAIGQALSIFLAAGSTSIADDQLEEQAKKLFVMVDRVKVSSESITYKVNASTDKSMTEPSGYAKAKAAHQTLKARTPEQEDKDEDEEIKSLVQTEDPINLDDIPF